MGEPPLRLIRSPEDAEEVAAEWLRHYGFTDARTTSAGSDGGVDVAASDLVVQVKAEMKPTGRPTVQQISGVAAAKGVGAAVFSLSGFTKEASSWATEAGVSLFSFDLQGVPHALNESARRLEADGRSAEKWADLIKQQISRFWYAVEDEIEAAQQLPKSPRYDKADLMRAWYSKLEWVERYGQDLLDMARDCESRGFPVDMIGVDVWKALVVYLYSNELTWYAADYLDDVAARRQSMPVWQEYDIVEAVDLDSPGVYRYSLKPWYGEFLRRHTSLLPEWDEGSTDIGPSRNWFDP